MGTHNNELYQIGKELTLGATEQEIYDCLNDLTDDDYNGNNGEEYYMTFKTSTGKKRMARLEEAMTHIDEYKELGDFITYVLGDCYALDPYYKDFSIFITMVYDKLIIVLSYIA